MDLELTRAGVHKAWATLHILDNTPERARLKARAAHDLARAVHFRNPAPPAFNSMSATAAGGAASKATRYGRPATTARYEVTQATMRAVIALLY